jgi:hypothetical protein
MWARLPVLGVTTRAAIKSSLEKIGADQAPSKKPRYRKIDRVIGVEVLEKCRNAITSHRPEHRFAHIRRKLGIFLSHARLGADVRPKILFR